MKVAVVVLAIVGGVAALMVASGGADEARARPAEASDRSTGGAGRRARAITVAPPVPMAPVVVAEAPIP